MLPASGSESLVCLRVSAQPIIADRVFSWFRNTGLLHYKYVTGRELENLVNEFTRRSLPDLFEIPPQAKLFVGCDVGEGGDHDHLRVECVWRVSNLLKRAVRSLFFLWR